MFLAQKHECRKKVWKKGWSLRRGKGPFLVYYYLSSQLLPLARMGLPLVGAKGEEQLLDKLKSYVTVTGVLFRLITKKHTEDTASNPFLIFKIVF